MPSELELSHPLDVDTVGDDGFAVTVKADDAARARIAGRLGLADLRALTADFRVSPLDGGEVAVEGDLKADGDQICVVTLDPVGFSIRAALSGICVPADSAENQRDEFSLEDDETDVLGEISDNTIDLGEIAVQQLALELDPFPRVEGAEPPAETQTSDDAESGEDGPFAALAELKKTLT